VKKYAKPSKVVTTNELAEMVSKFSTTLQLPESTSMKVTKSIVFHHQFHKQDVARLTERHISLRVADSLPYLNK